MENTYASFWTQADALLRKNLVYQKRNMSTNCRLILSPIIIFAIFFVAQKEIDKLQSKVKDLTECKLPNCPIPTQPKWPPLLQVPSPQYRAVRSAFDSSIDLPDNSCRKKGNCPITTLITGNNEILGQALAGNMFTRSSLSNSTDIVLGSNSTTAISNSIDPAFKEPSLYNIKSKCTSNATFTISVPHPFTGDKSQQDVECVQSLNLWRYNSSEINNQIYKGFKEGNPERKYNEIFGAYDFINSNSYNFNVNVWYNATLKFSQSEDAKINLLRLPRALNLISNAYLEKFYLDTRMVFEFVKEMPEVISISSISNIINLLSTLLFVWLIILLFPVVLTTMVYEKQEKLRIMMKMHGLSDGPYWMISYMYFLSICTLYMFMFVLCGSFARLQFFTLNDYSIQFVFYFLYINLQISAAFLSSIFFSNVKTATVVSYICVFGTGLLSNFLFMDFIEDTSIPRGWIIFMELYPGFSLYRGLYEFGQYAIKGSSVGTNGMKWDNLSDNGNGMKEVMIIMLVQCLVFLFVAYYVDQGIASGSGKDLINFLKQRFQRKLPLSSQNPNLSRNGSHVSVDIDKPDVIKEKKRVKQFLLEPTINLAIACDDLRKVYPGRDGNAEKLAVKGLYLALPRGQCFGMLGPNGAGKTSFISMMIGLTTPTSGTAFVEGFDIRTKMDRVYTTMGVCPQHDLLWETLTGREHLLFYGRLKNLKGSALERAVEESLKSLNLFDGGVANEQAGKYSGGMKRRLSVAISLIGNPKVVYMDEPSTGLDPASRNTLWNVVKRAKEKTTIILTTHSMEEAEKLCDRLGIFVNGSLQCIGNSKELKDRYGGSSIFSMTTSVNDEHQVEEMVLRLCPNAKRIYHLAGTQKFELPKNEIKISNVFQEVESAKRQFLVYAWGISNTTLEDVFIKVVNLA